ALQIEAVVISVIRSHRIQRSRSAASGLIPAQPLDRRYDLGPVRGELLHRSRSTAGAHHRDHIIRLSLLGNKFLESSTEVCNAFKRKSKVIDDDGNRAANALGP